MQGAVMLLALLALLPLSLVGLGYAVFGEPYWPVFKRHRLALSANWPGHLSIVHISDLHVRRHDPRLLRSQKQALRGLAPSHCGSRAVIRRGPAMPTWKRPCAVAALMKPAWG
jgi:hypothetical protein